MTTSKIRIMRETGDDKIPFSNLAPGDWYESESCYGLCMKLDALSFWCFDKRGRYFGLPEWPCRVVNVCVKYRVQA